MMYSKAKYQQHKIIYSVIWNDIMVNL
jgi:hypothetical protein